MSNQRLVEIQGASWREIGNVLAQKVSEKSSFAYKFDREMYCDEADILELWKNNLASHSENSMRLLTPNAFDLCDAFDSVFSTRAKDFSVWELLTLYEVDMFLHEFHYKCRYCTHRIMKAPRYLCSGNKTHETKRSRKSIPEPSSVCSNCICDHPNCELCGIKLEPTATLHETSGLGIANKSGCTGFGYRDDETSFCGQTLEMATDTYNYGRFDTIYKLCNTQTGVSVLVYDVGCILSPFGINSNGLALCVFNLYNSDYALPPYSEHRVPMAAIQWEILLKGTSHVTDAFSLLADPGLKTFTSASFIVAAERETSVIEVSANQHWIPGGAADEDDSQDDLAPVVARGSGSISGSRWVIRANNCLAGSSLKELESLPPNISSRDRQKDLENSFSRKENIRKNPDWAKTALSTPTIQTEYCLGTIIMEPESLKMHVRFRKGTRISSTLANGGKWEVFEI